MKAGEQWPFRTEIVDRDRDFVEPELPCDIFQQLQVTDDFSAIDFNDQSVESRMIGYLLAQTPDRFRMMKKGDWEFDCDLDGTLLRYEVARIIDRSANHILG